MENNMKKKWKLAWCQARLNRRYCDQKDYEPYRGSLVDVAFHILVHLELK